MAKRTQQMLFRLILVLGAAASAAAQDFRIAEGERAEIHYAAGSAPLKYAATELGRYLDIITRSSEGVSPGPKRFVLLRDERKELGEDGFELAVTPEEFKITGSDLGVVFGVFHLLKTFGGCKFAGLGADGEYIPRSGEFRAPVGTYREVPSLWYRGLQLSWREPLELVIQRLDWMVRNGMNYLMYWCVAGEVDDPVGGTISDEEKFIPERARLHIPEEWFDRYVLPEIEKRGIKIDFNHHNLHYWLPPEKYYERHPEWYALRKGKRSRVTDHKQFAICTSDPEAVGELVSNVLAFLEKRPSVRIVGVVPEDGIGACECQGCASQDHFDSEITKRYEGDQSKTAGNINKTRRYERLIRAVASAVGERFPERLVGHAAYNDVRFPLVSEKMPTNVVTWVAMGGRDSASPIAETSPHDFNRFLHALLGEWRKNHNGKVILYEYYMGLDSMRSLPFPMWDVIGRDWESLKKLGVAGATVQCWATNHETYALNLLAFAEAGWGGEKSSDTLLDDYLVGRFLEGNDRARPLFRALHAAALEQGSLRPTMESMVPLLSRAWQTLPTVVDTQGLVGDALRRTRHLRLVETYWRRSTAIMEQEMAARLLSTQGKRTDALALSKSAVSAVEPLLGYVEAMPAQGWVSITAPLSWRRQTARWLANQ